MKEPRIRPEMRKYWDSLTPEQKEAALRRTQLFNIIKFIVIALMLLAIFMYSREASRLKDIRDARKDPSSTIAREEKAQRIKESLTEQEKLLKNSYQPLDDPDAPVGSEPRDESKDYSIDLGGGVTLEMVWIPPGYFDMGGGDALPVHRVQLDGLWIGRYEVTNAQWRRLNEYHTAQPYFDDGDLNGDLQPYSRMYHADAVRFCNWLSELTGEQYVLPTEAQWEYACRAGTTTANYWGDDGELCEHANVYDESLEEVDLLGNRVSRADCIDGYSIAAPVGSFPPNPWGLYDMIGNVAEICEDRYEEHFYQNRYASAKNPSGPVPTTKRGTHVVRGGSWHGKHGDWTSHARAGELGAFDAGAFNGFRVARNVEPRADAVASESNSEIEAED